MKTQETLKIEAILHEQRDRILAIAMKHGAKNVRIFGSVGRGEAKPNSDIDFLVDLSESLSPWFPVGFIRDLEALLGHKVDVVTEKSLHYFIRDRVLRRFPGKNVPFSRGQVLPESMPPADHVRVKPAPTGILFARNLLSEARSLH